MTGEIVLDDQNHLKTIHIATESFTIGGIPMFYEYNATLDLIANVTPDCKLEFEGRVYKSIDPTHSNPMVSDILEKYLTGNDFSREAYGDEVFSDLLSHTTRF